MPLTLHTAGIMPESVCDIPPTPLKSAGSVAAAAKAAEEGATVKVSAVSAPNTNTSGSVPNNSNNMGAPQTGKKHRNRGKDKEGKRGNSNSNAAIPSTPTPSSAGFASSQSYGEGAHQAPSPASPDSPGYCVYVHNGAHYFAPAAAQQQPPHDASAALDPESYALMYGAGGEGEEYPSADDFGEAMLYADESAAGVVAEEDSHYYYSSSAASEQYGGNNKYSSYYDMMSSKSAQAFFSGAGFYGSAASGAPASYGVPVGVGGGAHQHHHHGRDAPYQNNFAQAHRPMRGRGRGQYSRSYQSSQPYRKQQARSPRK